MYPHLFTDRSFTLFISLRTSSMFGISGFFGLLFPAQAFFSLRSFIRSIADDTLWWSPDGGRGGGGGGGGGPEDGGVVTDAVGSKSPTEIRKNQFVLMVTGK